MSHPLPLSERYALGSQIIADLTQKPLTLADIDTGDDTQPLDSLISQYASPYCQEFEYYDRRFGAKGEELVYTVWAHVYTGELDYDDGQPVTTLFKSRIYVPVTRTMTLDAIAQQVRDLIMDIEGNAATTEFDYSQVERLSDYYHG